METDSHQFKLLLTFDPVPETRESYFNYVLGEFVPTLEHLGLTMAEAWHTAYGEYPLRLTAFVAQDQETLDRILTSDTFMELESRLQTLVVNYTRRVVRVRSRFQF
ncbi:MAG TPA: hypothetical protein VJK02_19220 [Anaerolineales bacterium]|jgi:hypothetical protein|nr:hypothetical protein [Anaerolineales bacterium]